jgi:hypothetical protein
MLVPAWMGNTVNVSHRPSILLNLMLCDLTLSVSSNDLRALSYWNTYTSRVYDGRDIDVPTRTRLAAIRNLLALPPFLYGLAGQSFR